MTSEVKPEERRRSARKKQRRRSAITRTMERPPEANPNYQGGNGGDRVQKRDIYGDLEKIEERGKKKRKWLSLFGEKDKN